jgi:hypothetical protein
MQTNIENVAGTGEVVDAAVEACALNGKGAARLGLVRVQNCRDEHEREHSTVINKLAASL